MKEIYVCSDVHGQYKAFMKGIKELFHPGDKLYYLGDAIDRGPDAYNVLDFFGYSCAVTPPVRQTGNRLSGPAETAHASLLA